MTTKKSAPVQRPVTMIADDALEAVRHGKEHARWLSALMRAIQIDIDHNQGRCAKDLACLGQYIGDDCLAYLESTADSIELELGSTEVAP
ncbi:hypothetical protein ACK9U2_000939 [Pseudomonas putida]|uniref:hypothetical protein n=1 Tax=Pseudomonas shirazica TaxID=1940636 RepID=UPI003526BE12